jgi:hypothetical protein
VAAAGAAGVATSRVAVAPACEARSEGAGARERKAGEKREGIRGAETASVSAVRALISCECA